MRLILFGTSGCHLCEEAEVLLDPFQAADNNLIIEHIDIADQPEYYQRYAIQIPVLLNPESGEELGWPFTTELIKQLIFN